MRRLRWTAVLVTSIVLGVVGRNTDRERLRYGAFVFGYFIVVIVGLGWLMYLGHG